jgi:DNA-binding NtrC family response regulator
MRVLVVDDDPDQVIVRCMVLSHHGFETRRAGDVESALQAARDEAPEIAVVDLGIPTERDGLRLIGELKTAHPTISIVVLTGSSIARLAVKPELRDVAALIEKGHSCKALLGALEQVVAGRTF